MARTSRPDVEKRTLIGFILLIVALGAVLGGAHWRGTAELAPKLGLDLQGGTQLILKPRLVGDQTVSSEQVAQARDIMNSAFVAVKDDTSLTSVARLFEMGFQILPVVQNGKVTRSITRHDLLRAQLGLGPSVDET